MHTMKLMWVGLAATLLGVGCDTIQAPDPVRRDTLPAEAYSQQVVLGGLKQWVVSAKPIVDRGENKPLRVTVPLRSVANKTINVQYRFEWMDAKGRPVKDDSGWRFKRIAPKTQVFLEANALDTDVANWRLQVRPAK